MKSENLIGMLNELQVQIDRINADLKEIKKKPGDPGYANDPEYTDIHARGAAMTLVVMKSNIQLIVAGIKSGFFE